MSNRLERVVAMDEEIRKERYPNVKRFCEMFEVQPRTVYEDIRFMKENMGLEIDFDRFRNGYYNKNPKKQLPSFQLTDGEVFALTLGKEMLTQYSGTSFEPVLKSALEKIYQRLPERVEMDLTDLRSMVRFNPGPVIPVSRKMFIDLNRACETHTPVEIEYFTASRNEVTKRTIDPYRLLENRGAWYAVAYCHARKGLRIFALHRIRDYSLKDEKFEPTLDPTIDEWLSSAFQLEHREQECRVKIAFLPNAAKYIRERNWHPSQELLENADGSCVLSFTTASLDEVKRWVLGYGGDAQVMEPEALKQMVKEDLEHALARYSTPASSN